MAGLYVHIPFCKSRCIYCGFYSTTMHDVQGRYVDALIRELEIRSDYLRERAHTIYIGGGTPSTLTPDNLHRLSKALCNHADVDADDFEFTVECNPDDVNRDFAETLVACGVTRVSMGVQSFSDKRLRFLHRRHNADNAIFAVRALRNAGIKNISIDLMFGFPNETMDDLEHDISHAIRLDVEHISAYSLQYEEGTPLYRMLEEGVVREIDEDLSRSMYERLCYRLESADYEHYEISNFARPGFRSRHNSNYWKERPYLGLGAAAHSYDGQSRQWNVSDVLGYMDSILNEGKEAVEDSEVLDEQLKYNDLITTALRTCEGISLESHTVTPFKDYLIAQSRPLIEKGLLVEEDGNLHLTHEGLYVCDAVMAELVFV